MPSDMPLINNETRRYITGPKTGEEYEGDKIVSHADGVYVARQSLGYTYTTSSVVYFVSGDDGDEYGQFAEEWKALARARFIRSVPRERRREHDQ